MIDHWPRERDLLIALLAEAALADPALRALLERHAGHHAATIAAIERIAAAGGDVPTLAAVPRGVGACLRIERRVLYPEAAARAPG
jgi:hypothetical protein